MSDQKAKILFVIRGIELFPYYKSIVSALAKRGYAIRILFDKKWSKEEPLRIIRSELEKDGIECGWAATRHRLRKNFLFYTRELLNYRRYLLSEKKGKSIYYDRWEEYLPKSFRVLLTFAFVQKAVKSNFFALLLRFAEKSMPPNKKITADIRSYAPRAVIASPVNMRFSSADLEYLKASKYLRIPSIIPVISWDNLTTKGLFHIQPDLLLVWNDAQKEDALHIHTVPEHSIKIIGAPFFDIWFSSHAVSRTREEFCALHGLKSNDPIVLYLGSSKTVAENEAWLVKQLQNAFLSAPDARMQNTQIIIRPHPANFSMYDGMESGTVKVIPKNGDVPGTQESFQLFYDSLFHSVCAIGISTSGMIDAIAAGKPVIAIMPDEYASTQKIIEHFQQMARSGAVEMARTSEECIQKIQELVSGHDALKEKRIEFVKNFLRPRGMNFSAGDAAADEIENFIQKHAKI